MPLCLIFYLYLYYFKIFFIKNQNNCEQNGTKGPGVPGWPFRSVCRAWAWLEVRHVNRPARPGYKRAGRCRSVPGTFIGVSGRPVWPPTPGAPPPPDPRQVHRLRPPRRRLRHQPSPPSPLPPASTARSASSGSSAIPTPYPATRSSSPPCPPRCRTLPTTLPPPCQRPPTPTPTPSSPLPAPQGGTRMEAGRCPATLSGTGSAITRTSGFRSSLMQMYSACGCL